MSACRIVCNEMTGLYRIETRGGLGWGFVRDEKRQDYATVPTYDGAPRSASEQLPRRANRNRRRRLVDFCARLCSAG